MFKALRRSLGLIKYRLKNQWKEWRNGREEQFHFDIRFIEPLVRTAYYNPKPIGFSTRVMLTERVVEYPLTFQALPANPTTVLDVGSGNSPLPYHLACTGHSTVAVDFLSYPIQHPNLTALRCDATKLPFRNETFRYVTAISSLEHFGLGGYGDPILADGPLQARTEILRVLKPGGSLIVSLPVGSKRKQQGTSQLDYHVFSRTDLKGFTKGFKISTIRFFHYIEYTWMPCSEIEAFSHDSERERNTAIVFMRLTKPRE